MITDPDEFFTKGCGRCARFETSDCSVQAWAGALSQLRRICDEAGLSETAKWGHPCYMHAGRNIVILGAFRGDVRLTFFNATLLKDPKGLLQKTGKNSQHPDIISFQSAEEVLSLEPQLRSYLAEAMGYAQQGIKPKVETRDIELPPELIEALADDPELSTAFYALTPGRQRSYALNLNGAKQPATRVARIEKFRPKILMGKGATER